MKINLIFLQVFLENVQKNSANSNGGVVKKNDR
jgi:hypothetical protein